MNALRVLSDQRTQLDSCAYCPKLCRFACPVSEATGREGFTPWGKMSTAFLVERSARPPDAALAEAAYACSGCGRCGTFCRNHIDVPEALGAARGNRPRQRAPPRESQYPLGDRARLVAEHGTRGRSRNVCAGPTFFVARAL